MNEILSVPSDGEITTQSNLHINKFILLIPLILLVVKSMDGLKRKSSDIFSLGSELIASIDYESLSEKIDMLKKIGPYLPENLIYSLNSIVLIGEKAVKVIGLMDFVSTNKSYQPISSIGELSSKDRINGILSTIKDDISDEKVKNIKPAIDIILNFDKYKDLVNMFSSLNSMTNKIEKKPAPTEKTESVIEPSESNKNQLESMINLIKPILGDNPNISTEKISDMFKMLQVLNMNNASDNKN
ncbi:hypothetical protein SAMN05660462_00488 [Proteiniborus ethanoligenes]|uniref:Uncharacterized protein n=1 Tax=Proteiniborus ethanoligenes TaxID=415015 RepID=A0A1H3LEC4_9FIRM|nr:hypothetical protein [Proteiniborus ethanoligenes]SDY62288.1 hypothetical protein SAMN05660462_00488 [Proteiniborus ethanoligenes]